MDSDKKKEVITKAIDKLIYKIAKIQGWTGAKGLSSVEEMIIFSKISKSVTESFNYVGEQRYQTEDKLPDVSH